MSDGVCEFELTIRGTTPCEPAEVDAARESAIYEVWNVLRIHRPFFESLGIQFEVGSVVEVETGVDEESGLTATEELMQANFASDAAEAIRAASLSLLDELEGTEEWNTRFSAYGGQVPKFEIYRDAAASYPSQLDVLNAMAVGSLHLVPLKDCSEETLLPSWVRLAAELEDKNNLVLQASEVFEALATIGLAVDWKHDGGHELAEASVSGTDTGDFTLDETQDD